MLPLGHSSVRANESDVEIVLMDAVRDGRERSSGLIIHDLSRALDDTGHLVTLEPTHQNWKRHNQLHRRKPQLVILNRFLFHDGKKVYVGKYEQLTTLIHKLSDLETKFIIYTISRYPKAEKVKRIKESVCKIFAAKNCDDRFSFINLRDTRANGSFPASADEVKIEDEIKRLLKPAQPAADQEAQ